MTLYRYTAVDQDGHRVDGHVDAESIQDARSQLDQDGLQILELMEVDRMSDSEPTPRSETLSGERLSLGEVQELAEQVAQLSAANMPLAPGFRAAGDECIAPRLKRMFHSMADQLDRGRSLAEVLDAARGLFPGYGTRLIRAAAETSELGPALAELVDNYSRIRDIRRNLWKGLAYPAIVAGMALVILVFIVSFVAGGFERILAEFGTPLPFLTELFFWWRSIGLWLGLAVLAAVAVLLILARWRLGKVGWQAWIASMPILGPLWHGTALLEWISLLHVLVRYRIPLHDALRLAGEGISNVHLGAVSQALAEGVARGRSLSQMIAVQHQIPAGLVPLVRWGEESNGLAESLEMGREMLEERVRMRSLWLRMALPPILFIAIGCCLLFVVGGGMLLPLFSLISTLA